MNLENELLSSLLTNCDLARVQELIADGVDLNYELEDDSSFLAIAAAEGHLDIVQILVEAGANVNPVEDPVDWPLDRAAGQGWQKIFDYLAPLTSPRLRRLATMSLPSGIRWRAKEEEWRDDFTKVAAKSNLEAIQALLIAGTDINTVGTNGCTVLWTAAHNGFVDSVRLLIEAGADVSIKNRTDGWSSLMIAVATHQAWVDGTQEAWGENRSRQIEVFRLLLDAGADINTIASNGRNPLMETVISGSTEMVEILLRSGAEVSTRDNDGNTSLDLAQQTGYADIAQLLRNIGG